MTGISRLSVDGKRLKNGNGQIIAEINGELPGDMILAYANAFASAADMLNLLKDISASALSDFQQQYDDAIKFNNQAIVPVMGPTARNIPELPSWLKEALVLISCMENDLDS